jgi:hypothetical protein
VIQIFPESTDPLYYLVRIGLAVFLLLALRQAAKGRRHWLVTVAYAVLVFQALSHLVVLVSTYA